MPPQYYPSKPAVTKFNDAQGYYAGDFFGDPCPPGYLCWAERDGSAVIPARGLYSSRIADFDGNPIDWLYGRMFPWLPSWYGSGKPGDDNVQFGVNIELKSKAGDDAYNSTATLGFSNYSVDIESTVDETEITMKAPGTYTVTYQTVVENTGTEVTNNVIVTYTLDADLTAVSLTSTGGTDVLSPTKWSTATLAPDAVVTVTLVATGTAALPLEDDALSTQVDAYDGQIARGPWFFDTDVWVPFVLIVTPTDGEFIGAITTTTVPIEIATLDFDIPDDGHWNLWVDGSDMGQVLTYTTATSLTLGTHVISAELRLTDDTVLGPVDTISVTVEPYAVFLPIVLRN